MNTHPFDESLAKQGRLGDSKIRNVKGEPSHVNPLEALIIDIQGKKGEELVSMMGSGTINPKTGMREYIAWVPLIIAAVQLLGMYKIASGGDWSPYTKQWSGKDDATTKLMQKGVTSFQDLTDLYGKEGKFEGVSSVADAIKGLRYNLGGYGSAEKSDWSELGGGMDAFRNFNPIKALQDKLSPIVHKLKGQKTQGTKAATAELGKLSRGLDVGGPSVGQPQDIFKVGAGIQSEADKMFASEFGQEKKASEADIYQDWYSLL